jgi:cation:H+ antiporter
MPVIGHILLALGAVATVWLLSGQLIDATDRVAKRYHKPGFAVAFFVLGILTSISELSVATNATLERVPQVSAGNLLGASTVIFLLIIPLLAALGNGIPMEGGLQRSNLVVLLLVVLLPSLLAMDGSVSVIEGVVMLMAYAILILRLQKKRPAAEVAKDALERTQQELVGGRRATAVDTIKIAVSAVLIFVAGNILVDESVYLAGWLGVPVSFVGLMLLSIGTNIPELIIAVRCVVGKHKDIAFGDYLGSAAFNTAIFGFLPLANGGFILERSEAVVNAAVLGTGLALFFLFGWSKNILSRRESLALLFLYAAFLVLQVGNAVRIADPGAPDDTLKRAAPLSQVSAHP